MEHQPHLFDFEDNKRTPRAPLSRGSPPPPPLSEDARMFVSGAPLDSFQGLRLPRTKRARPPTSRERSCEEHLSVVSADVSEEQTLRGLRFFLEAEYGVPAPLVDVLARRLLQLSGGNLSHQFVSSFLNPSLVQIPHWSRLGGCAESAKAMLSLLKSGKRPFLVGDYDVDGVTSLAQVIWTFRALGFEPDWGIPHRLDEGYGRLERILLTARTRGAGAVFTMDFGTANAADFALAAEFGMRSFVIDHHSLPPEFERPSDYYINPALCGYADNVMAASGLTNRFLHALIDLIDAEGPREWRRRLRDFDTSTIDSLAALGTIADVMPLVGANRALVKFGLDALAESALPGVRAMLDRAELSLPLDSQAVAFRLAPPLNAAGRLEDGSLSLKLLIARSPDDAAPLACYIDGLNAKRKEIETEMVRRAEGLMGRRAETEPALMVYHRRFHKGVNGIACSRLVNRYHKVGLVGTQQKNGDVEASLRSNGRVDLNLVIEAIRPLTKKAGGHAMAGGVIIESRNLRVFRETFFRACEDQGQKPKVNWNVVADMDVPLRFLPKLLPQLSRLRELLGPFGCANEQPTFLARNVMVRRESLPDRRHWRGDLAQRSAQAHASMWHDANHPVLRRGGKIDIVYQVSAVQDSAQPKIELLAAVRSAPTNGSR